jgi:hypothetical protein
MAKAKTKSGGPLRGKRRVRKMGMNSGRALARAKAAKRG